jgi:hypothetical protein
MAFLLAFIYVRESAAADLCGRGRRNSRLKFSDVAAAISSADKFLTLASVRATSAT